MILAFLYNKLTGISPYFEVFLRKYYWNNVSKYSKFRPGTTRDKNESAPVNFDRVLKNLSDRGVQKGSIIIVHSSYDLLENTGLSPEEINSKLLELVGTEGTIVMPAIRKYKEEGKLEDYLVKEMEDIVCTYDVQRSKIISGLLPAMLTRRQDSYVSMFPLNPVVAVGKDAEEMVRNNLNGDYPSAHGQNSSWNYCVKRNALVIGLGVDMPHFLTITHVNEECFENWPINNWFRERKFVIINKGRKTEKVVLERRPVWGTFYFAENKYKRDLIKSNILKIETVEGLKISILESEKVIDFLHSHPHKGYPYYVRSKDLK